MLFHAPSSAGSGQRTDGQLLGPQPVMHPLGSEGVSPPRSPKATALCGVIQRRVFVVCRHA